MDNVLGELFTGIAEAIRSKTGGTESIKPSEFADQIAGIHTGDGEGLSLTYTVNSFTANGTVSTVNHGLGKVPDIIIVYPSHVPQNNDITLAFGFSKALMHTIANYSSKYPGKIGYTATNISYSTLGTIYGFDEVGNENQTRQGHIREVNAATFKVGSDAGGSYPSLVYGERYGFVAISGFFS